jgi:glycosyltransferase involved in cell wall biosynthesis
MESRAEVGVVIPLYNKGSFVKRALDSVLSQTYQDFEIVVVDDGSTDHGVEVVRGFSDPRIRLIKQPNAGPGAARNRGAEETCATYLVFLDADDEWMPSFIEVYRGALKNHPECGAVVGPTFFGSDKIDRSQIWRRMGVEAGEWSLGNDPSWGNLSRITNLFSTPGTMFRREVFERYGGFYSKDNCRYSEDKYLWLQVVLNHRVFILLEPLFWYHSEASQLYPPNMYCQPGFIPPMVSDPDGILRNCPAPFLSALQKYLCDLALGALHENAYVPIASEVLKHMKTLPVKRYFTWRYAKARIKVLLWEVLGVRVS